MIFETSLRTQRGTPRKMNAKRVEQAAVEAFNRDGRYFSVTGHTAASLLNYLTRHRIPFTLSYCPGTGYMVTKGVRVWSRITTTPESPSQ